MIFLETKRIARSLAAASVVALLSVLFASPAWPQETRADAVEVSPEGSSVPPRGEPPMTDPGPRSTRPEGDEFRKYVSYKRSPPPWLTLVTYLLLPVGFIFVLHAYDSFKAYSWARDTRDALLKRLEGSTLTPERIAQLADAFQPVGLSGTSRSMFTYGLLIVLGVAVFHLLAFDNDPHALNYADKIITVLAGALSSVIGFYFGSRATREGAETAGGRPPEVPRIEPTGKITKVDPAQAKLGQEVTIVGIGFGTDGSVKFDSTHAPKTIEWGDSKIRVKVPDGLPTGPTTISVNPSKGDRIPGTDIAFEIE
jgi:hypothetical protein